MQVKNLIAYGDVNAPTQPYPTDIEWLRNLIANAQSALQDAGPLRDYRDRYVGSLDRFSRLELAMTEAVAHEVRMRLASETLRVAARQGQINITGQPANWHARQSLNDKPREIIDAAQFTTSDYTITDDGWLTSSPDAYGDQESWSGCAWNDLRFGREKALALWGRNAAIPTFVPIALNPDAGAETAQTSPAKIPAAAEYPVSKTGAPGRPNTMQFVRAEFERRAASGVLAETLTHEADILREWLVQAHPVAPRPTTKTIKNNLRERYRTEVTQKAQKQA